MTPALLAGLVQELNPLHEEIFRRYRVNYDWSVYQSEWALDVVFRQADFLKRLYPRLVRQAMLGLGSQDVLRFLGRAGWRRGTDAARRGRSLPAGRGLPAQQ